MCSIVFTPSGTVRNSTAAAEFRACVCWTGFDADHTRFEGIDQEFEEGKTSGDDTEGDDGLSAESWNPKVVDEVCRFGGFDSEVVEL